jgi:Flp pilus assembly protein TadG
MERHRPHDVVDASARRRAPRRAIAGSISLIFALAIVPLLLAVGACVDYGIALIVEMQLQTAADSASLGCLSQKAPAIVAAIANGTTGEVTGAETDAIAIAKGSFGTNALGTLATKTATVTFVANSFTAKVDLTAKVPTYFMGMIGVKSLTVGASSTSTFKPALYYRFYILVDNSPSQGLGATTTDISKLETATSKVGETCAFACHITGSTTDWYAYAKKNGITLRINSVVNAVTSMITKAKNSQSFSGQYQMAVYTMGVTADDADNAPTLVYGPSSDLDTVASKTSAIDLMTIAFQGYNNDQQTNLKKKLSELKTTIGTSGSGVSSADPIKILFVITDGVEDTQRTPCAEKLTGSRCQQEMDYSECTKIKANGVRVVGLYTTYQRVPNNSWYMSYVDPYRSKIPLAVKACASDSLYLEVGPNDDVGAALATLFTSVVSMTHLSK